jgi:hypothetical protein
MPPMPPDQPDALHSPVDLAYTWDFGDGTTATGQTVTHTYASAGA